MDTLPGKPSELILLALSDLEKIEADSDTYSVDMSDWHKPNSIKTRCYVCLAGAVIAKTLNCSPFEHRGPSCFSGPVFLQLIGLNYLREGLTQVGVGCFVGKVPRSVPQRMPVVRYAGQPAQFKKDMRAIAQKLADCGL